MALLGSESVYESTHSRGEVSATYHNWVIKALSGLRCTVPKMITRFPEIAPELTELSIMLDLVIEAARAKNPHSACNRRYMRSPLPRKSSIPTPSSK